jgi:hypothetical protein
LLISCHRIVPVWEGTASVFLGSVEKQQPAVIQSADGEWFVVFTSITDPLQSEGVLLLTRAPELQGPWTSPQPIAHLTLECRNPRMSQMKDGLIQIVFELGRMQDTGWQSDGLALIQSYDYGRRFSVPRPIPLNEMKTGIPAQGLTEISHDYWILPVLFREENQPGAGLASTRDGGETWTFQVPSAFSMPVEVLQLMWDPDSGLMACMQIQDCDQIYYTASGDTGHSWLDPFPVDIYGNDPILTRKTDGTLICFYNDRTPPGFSMMSSFDQGRTYEQEIHLIPSDLKGKPWISWIEPNQIALFYTDVEGIFIRSRIIDTVKAPGGVSVSNDSVKVILRWNPDPLAAYYQIFRSESLNDSVWTEPFRIASVSAIQYEDRHVQNNRIYAYTVSAIAVYGPEVDGRMSEGSISKTVRVDMRKYHQTGEP